VLWEAAATVLLTHRRLADPSVTSFGQAVWESAFHSVSSFCNAGISIYPEGIERWRDDPISLMVAMILVVVGGIGLLTLVNFRYYYPWRRDRLKRGRLTLQTKICLSVTVVLLAAGGLFTLVSEWNHTLKSVGWAERLELALFHSVMTRSGGFNLVDVGEMTPKTLLGTLVLMLIGGSPGSMAGGLKVPTLVLLIASAKAALQRRTELTWSRSTLAPIQANVAVMMVLFAVAVLTIGIGALMHTELDQASSETGHRWLAIVFEAISAFATVGLSTGITGELSGPGKGVVVVLMLVGRLGPMFLALHLTRPASPPRVSFPQEELAVG
jgi:trk system potassium uptake protein TrkH